jgi:hypothetical protein
VILEIVFTVCTTAAGLGTDCTTIRRPLHQTEGAATPMACLVAAQRVAATYIRNELHLPDGSYSLTRVGCETGAAS